MNQQPYIADIELEQESGADLDLLEAFREGAIPSTLLGELGIPPRVKLVGEWLCEADLTFVFARPGIGKTWFSLGLAAAIAGKVQFGPWQVHQNARVLYVDGEMPCESIHERVSSMRANENLVVINHEALFHKTGKVLNLTDRNAQSAITSLCQEKEIKVLILDNLSCLFSGVNENEADAWEAVLPWLLELRRRRIAVVIVAHSGRDGKNMRGTSRREDAAFSVIRLDDVPSSDGELKNGARFIARFAKHRNCATEPPAYEWTFQTMFNGKIAIDAKVADGLTVFLQWVADGLSRATDIAAEMGISKGTVSKMAKKAAEAGRLKIDKGVYSIP